MISSAIVAPFLGRTLVSHEGKLIGWAWVRVRENSKKKIVGSERQEPLGNIVDELMDFHSAPP